MSDSFDFFYSLFHIQYSKAEQSLGRKVKFFNPLGFEPKSPFSHKACKIKSHSGLQDST